MSSLRGKAPRGWLYKAKTNRRGRGLELPEHCNVSLQFAEKGSYRTEHILRYLGRWLEEWTPERARLRAWRILYMDVAKSHLAEEIIEFAHGRGYCIMLHYGCTTGVAQINDTDLHCDLEARYVELEQMSFHTSSYGTPATFPERCNKSSTISAVPGRPWITLEARAATSGWA